MRNNKYNIYYNIIILLLLIFSIIGILYIWFYIECRKTYLS